MRKALGLSAVVLFTMLATNLSSLSFCATISSSYSFVYNYGNAKVWVYVQTDKNLTVGPNRNSTIAFTVYLEKLGSNSAVYLNRITFSLKGTPVEKVTSPNVTLQSNNQSWLYDVTFSDEDVSPVLGLGQALDGYMGFEFRYDVIDSTGGTWSYRVNEEIPVRFINIEEVGPQWLSFETLFITVTLIGIGSAAVLILFRIRRYKKTQKPA